MGEHRVGAAALEEAAYSFSASASTSTSSTTTTTARKQQDALVPPPASWKTFEPLVSDAIVVVNTATSSTSSRGKSERFVFLPNRRFISVLAYKTGKRIATLVFNNLDESNTGDDGDGDGDSYDDKQVELTSVVLSTQQQQQPVLLAGCSDGTIREFHLKDLQRPIDSYRQSVGPYSIPGACLCPRRSIRIANTTAAVRHLGVASSLESEEEQTVVYALVEQQAFALEEQPSTSSSSSSSSSRSQGLSLLRVTIPHHVSKDRQVSLMGNVNVDDTDADTDDSKQAPVCCMDKNVKLHPEKEEEPFCMKVTTLNSSPRSIFVVLGFRHSLLIYHEKIRGDPLMKNRHEMTTFPPVPIDMPQSNPLTAVAISPNGHDIACGYSSGCIQVWTSLLVRVEEYCQAMAQYKAQQDTTTPSLTDKKPKHPARGLIVRKLHWHAHPVSTLTFGGGPQGGEPMLYSGGDESVLVTWQLSRGISKPVEVLPRVALGGIIQMTSVYHPGEPDSILLFCADNSLSLFETHNQFRRWKIQGLAAGPGPTIFPTRPRLLVDPRGPDSPSPHLLLTGLSQAPGYIQTFDPRTQRVISSLEVAPYNRVSRTEPGDSPMPTPTISRCSFNKDGSVLLTIDVAPTENTSVGACEKLPSHKLVGSITTIRFWATDDKNPISNNYVLVAAMASPHGSENHVSAAALSSDGNFACTVSNDEKAFRLWRRVIVPNEHDSAAKTAEWVCRYRVDIPAGFSNYPTGTSAVSFSEDGSVLAIGFGSMVTLWDHHEVTLLTTLGNFGDNTVICDNLQFLSSTTMKDALLVSSSRVVALQSPYGMEGPLGLGWVWKIPRDKETTRVTAVEHIASMSAICIVMFDEGNDKSHIVIIDAVSGEKLEGLDAPLEVSLADEIVSIAASRQSVDAFGWNEDTSQTKQAQTLYALTKNGELISLCDDKVDTAKDIPQNDKKLDVLPVTKLPYAIGSHISRKRPTSLFTSTDLEEVLPRKKVSLEHFGGFIGEEVVETSLPLLSGSFARAFVGRHLQRNSH